MKIVFCLVTLVALIIPALAEEHNNGHKADITISTEGMISGPYKRASISFEKSGWTLTPGVASSEGRNLAFANFGYRFKWKLEHGGELFVEPHVGFARGNTLGTSAVFGGRFEVESHNWIMAGWVDTYRGGGVQFTTCEPLAEVARHVGRGFFFGASSSCYIGPANKSTVESHGHHEVQAHTEHLIYVGPTGMLRLKRALFGVSYEVGKGNERIFAGYANFRW